MVNGRTFHINRIAAKKFASPSEGAAEGGCEGKSAAPERFAERSEAGQWRFRFLDLCIRFGKMIPKACSVGNLFSFGVCEGFNSGVKKNRLFGGFLVCI